MQKKKSLAATRGARAGAGARAKAGARAGARAGAGAGAGAAGASARQKDHLHQPPAGKRGARMQARRKPPSSHPRSLASPLCSPLRGPTGTITGLRGLASLLCLLPGWPSSPSTPLSQRPPSLRLRPVSTRCRLTRRHPSGRRSSSPASRRGICTLDRGLQTSRHDPFARARKRGRLDQPSTATFRAADQWRKSSDASHVRPPTADRRLPRQPKGRFQLFILVRALHPTIFAPQQLCFLQPSNWRRPTLLTPPHPSLRRSANEKPLDVGQRSQQKSLPPQGRVSSVSISDGLVLMESQS